MPYFSKRYYYRDEDRPKGLDALESGYTIVEEHKLFSKIPASIYVKSTHLGGRDAVACVTGRGDIYLNVRAGLDAEQWAYVMAHNLLHLALGHFDRDHIPQDVEYNPKVWNKACDIYVARFLADIGFGRPVFKDPADEYPIKLTSEEKIYEYLLEHEGAEPRQTYGLASVDSPDMIGIASPITYKAGESNRYADALSRAINRSMKNVVSEVGGREYNEKKDTVVMRAAQWFLAHYPLLGGLAASFKIIEDVSVCYRYEIRIAAVDASHGEIYANPSCGLSEEEWRFVLAHEYLHAGLCHQKRCMGRDPYLWNVACDYVINDWLHEMRIGEMPSEGLLYDETLRGMSAEAIYDLIVKELRRFKKLDTFRGYGKGDIFGGYGPRFEGMDRGITLDEFFQNSLREGLDYHVMRERGYIPAGLVEEIRALAMPPIPWDVELGKWFDEQFPPLEKHRTYARPSRRQGSTPDIPRPSYVLQEQDLESRTFGVVIDTSGSMSSSQIGLALGAVASYAVAKEVRFVRIVFCDAEATDAGYMAPEDIAGRVEVTGRGGTVLQPGVDTLITAEDFPRSGPILIITDAEIESGLKVRREHAFLIPHGKRLPFTPKGKVFYMENKERNR